MWRLGVQGKKKSCVCGVIVLCIMVWYLALQLLITLPPSSWMYACDHCVKSTSTFPSSKSGLADIMIGMMERLLTLLGSILDFFVDVNIPMGLWRNIILPK